MITYLGSHDTTPADLALVRTFSPRLRSSRYEDILVELQHELGLDRQITPTPNPARDKAVLDAGPPPDGGRDAWLCVVGAFLVLFCVFGFVTSMGQLQAYYLEHQLAAYSKPTVAWISSCQSMFTFLGSVFFGRLFDVHGARGLVIGGTLLSFGALVGISFCKEYYQFLLAHAAFGISGSFIYSPATGIAAHWFLRRRSTAVGVIVCGAGLGGVVYPILIRELCAKLAFRDAMLTVAGFNLVLMIPACFWMKTRLPPRDPPPISALAKPWKEPRYTFLVLGACVIAINFFTPYFNAPVYTAASHASPNVTAYSIAIIQAGSFIGRVSSGFLADRFGVWTVFGTAGFSSSISVFALWTANVATAGSVIGLLVYGAASGAWITLVAACVASISPTCEIGMRLGMLWSAIALPILPGPVVSGKLITAAGGKFTLAAAFVGSTLLLGAALCVGPAVYGRLFARGEESQEADAASEETVVGDEGTAQQESKKAEA
ncbi:MFS transporter asaE [Vanrija pseudolonga]|uniref:MFS transporter asaE n=1 Tax=Vanrija pseudolonga TaxID=143232 RepID=A0AAF1BIC2_9TREE|nr:MFS transporter asaE [Vanrija pseudolonga]